MLNIKTFISTHTISILEVMHGEYGLMLYMHSLRANATKEVCMSEEP